MKKLYLITMISLTLTACDRHDKPKSPPPSGQEYDRSLTTTTPLDQSESETDQTITQKIRQAIMSDGSLSTNAKNIKIITVKGVVVIRGPVVSSQEKEAIAKKIKDIRGVMKVDNQLDVIHDDN